jgi:circadian clock protein KaiB
MALFCQTPCLERVRDGPEDAMRRNRDDNIVTPEASDVNTARSATGSDQPFVLKLFICGASPRADSAVANLRRICEIDLQGHYSLEIIDVLEQPHLAEESKVLATPTLIKVLPPPLRRIIGDLSDKQTLLVGLDVGRWSARPNPHPDSP